MISALASRGRSTNSAPSMEVEPPLRVLMIGFTDFLRADQVILANPL